MHYILASLLLAGVIQTTYAATETDDMGSNNTTSTPPVLAEGGSNTGTSSGSFGDNSVSVCSGASSRTSTSFETGESKRIEIHENHLGTIMGVNKAGEQISVPTDKQAILCGSMWHGNEGTFNTKDTSATRSDRISIQTNMTAPIDGNASIFIIGFAVPQENLIDGETYEETCDGSDKGRYYMLTKAVQDTDTTDSSWYQRIGTRAKHAIQPYFEEWNGNIADLQAYLPKQVFSAKNKANVNIMENVMFAYPGRLCLTVAYQYENDENLYFSSDTINLTVSD